MSSLVTAQVFQRGSWTKLLEGWGEAGVDGLVEEMLDLI